MADYSELDLHLVLSDQTEDEDILYGFAIKQPDRTSFMLDLEQLVQRYGGVSYDELLMRDDGSSMDAAIKASMVKEEKPIILDVQPIRSSRAKDQRPALEC